MSGANPLFDDELADPRDEGSLVEDRSRLCRQVTQLSNGQDRQLRRHLFDLLDARRGANPELPRVGLLPRATGQEVVIAWGELLLRTSDAERPRVAALIRRFGLATEPVECLQGRLLRCVNRDLRPRQLDRLARHLRGLGVTASVNHIAPLAPIVKGLGGPEPTTVRSGYLGPGREVGTGGVVVAVIDTGIAEKTRTDGWLESVSRSAGNIDELDAIPNGPDGYLDFAAGHGTFASGVVQQVAPAAEVRVLRAVDSDGVGSEVEVGCALVRAVQEGADIVNLSLGSNTADDLPPVALTVAMELVAEWEEEQGRTDSRALLVAAAGNNGDSSPVWPAAFRRVVSVGGLTADLAPASWSSRGFWVDCSTVGEGVVSTYVEGQESPELDVQPDTYRTNPWALWSGTSFAAPQIAGAVARLRQQGSPSVRHALRTVLDAGRPLPGFGRAVKILPGTGT